MEVLIHKDPWDVQNCLAALGLDEERLRDAVGQGYVAYISCTANHPRFIPGLWAWAETVRALREYLLPHGWRSSDDGNYAVVIAPTGQVAIAVATGDDSTGISDRSPSTKTPKGPRTFGAVLMNQVQFDFMAPDSTSRTEDVPAQTDDGDEVVTWLLLVHRTDYEVRCELSLPSSMRPGGHIDGWRERIILGALPLDPDRVDVTPPPAPDIDIQIKRRA